MISVKMDLAENPYQILIGDQILTQLGETLRPFDLGEEAVVVTNPVIRQHHGKPLADSLERAGLSVKFIEVPAGEESKSAAQAFALIERIAEYHVQKRVFLLAFGGGVVGDLTGYVAAAYRRGIPYVQVPTTLLAQVDSAIGGKVAIDLPAGKNLVGAFYQPRLVLSDVSLLASLDQRQIQNGLAEAVKYGVICDRNFFDYIEANIEKLVARNSKALTEVVANCSRIKARVVMNDEKETKGMRTILNFGHTVGHAIEGASRFQDYQHGEAVALGMRVALNISQRLGVISPASVQRVEALLTAAGLPERIEHLTVKEILKCMAHDKKFHGAKNKFVLATGIGSVKVVSDVAPDMIETAIKTYLAAAPAKAGTGLGRGAGRPEPEKN